MSKKTESIKETLAAEFPTARPGFINILVDALALHAKKEADYNPLGLKLEHNTFETMAKFADVRRKYNRLHHMIVDEAQMHVDEKLEDTVMDLGNYAFLFAEYLMDQPNED